MSEIHSGRETEAEVLVCPNCSGVEIVLESGDIGLPAWRCMTCKVLSTREELIVSKFKHELGSDSDILSQLVRSLRNTVAKDLAVSMGRFLMKWGFLDRPDPYLLSRYVNSCARAMLIAIIEERQNIEREKHGRN